MDPQNNQPIPQPPTSPPMNEAPQPSGGQTPMPSQNPTKPEKAYSKRPMWQWIAIYVVAAIILYGIVYYVFIRKSGSATTGY